MNKSTSGYTLKLKYTKVCSKSGSNIHVFQTSFQNRLPPTTSSVQLHFQTITCPHYSDAIEAVTEQHFYRDWKMNLDEIIPKYTDENLIPENS